MRITVVCKDGKTHVGDSGGFHSDGSFFLHEQGEEPGTGTIFSEGGLATILIELDKDEHG